MSRAACEASQVTTIELAFGIRVVRRLGPRAPMTQRAWTLARERLWT